MASRLIGVREKSMDKEKKEHFKKKLLQMKYQIMNSGVLRNSEDLRTSTDDLADEADLASTVINQQVTFNIRHRELEKLRLIDEALWRLENGTYGICEECDEPIGDKRLENQPWANLCVEHAEDLEREQSKSKKVHGFD
jgi:DnaK suppressor protein